MASWNPERPYDALAEKSLRDSGRGHLSRHSSVQPFDPEQLELIEESFDEWMRRMRKSGTENGGQAK